VFWRQTVIPLVQRSVSAMSEWLTPGYGRNLELRPDIDSLDALSPDRDAQWARLQATTFLTDDEKRASVGYGPIPQDLAHKYSPDQPRDDHGRWTNGDGGNSPFDNPMGVGGPKPPAKPPAPKQPQQPPTAQKPNNPKRPAAGPSDPNWPRKKPVPGQSGADGAKNVPEWAKRTGERPYAADGEYKGEEGNAFAKRLLDQKYPEYNGVHKDGPRSEWNEIKKWGNQHFK
jgi:hypothetical protein